ncbi:MAG: peptidoglycan DD-metalloendopeptidase family protein [Methylobacter sp.]|nr:peptidoglycan DD-metalloendopeptidase family protein [Methylobacter sp.]
MAIIAAISTSTGYAKQANLLLNNSVIGSTRYVQTETQSIIDHKIQRGENIFGIFFKLKLNKAELNQILNANAASKQFRNLSPGNMLQVKTNRDGELEQLTYLVNPITTLTATRNKNDFIVRLTTKINLVKPLNILPPNEEFSTALIAEPISSREIVSAQATINSSLFQAGKEAGLSNRLIMQLADIFAWDIDFATNLHSGDRFTIIYEKIPLDGKKTDNSEIIAAEFINEGQVFTAVRYRDKKGNVEYYTPAGKGMRKAFLSAPVDFARISSPFDLNRKHPVLNRIRAHKGVDYAARTGTPIKSTGDGIINFHGRKGGYGQVVIVQHGQHYETLYAHLSNFKKGLQDGDQIKQGDIIGYVGQSGLATGPHLHYEFRVDGIHRNPLTAKLTHSLPVNNTFLADFKLQAQFSLAQLSQAKARNWIVKNQFNINE